MAPNTETLWEDVIEARTALAFVEIAAEKSAANKNSAAARRDAAVWVERLVAAQRRYDAAMAAYNAAVRAMADDEWLCE